MISSVAAGYMHKPHLVHSNFPYLLKAMIWTSLLHLGCVASALPQQLGPDSKLLSRQETGLSLPESLQSIFIPWTSSLSRSSNSLPSLRGSIFGRGQTFLVDTGTTGAIISASLVPNVKLTQHYPAGWHYLARQETLLNGRFVTLDMTLRSKSRSAVSRVPVLIVTNALRCPGYNESNDSGVCRRRNAQRVRLGNIIYLGVGFGDSGTGGDNPFSTPANNPFLNIISIDGANVPALRTGYAISSRGIQLGLTPNNTAGAVWTPLLKTTDPDPRAWALPQLSFTINNSSEPVQAEALVDTSTPCMYIQSSPQIGLPSIQDIASVRQVRPGTKLTFAFPNFDNGVAGYDFVVGDMGFPSQPSVVEPVDAVDGIKSLVNLGRNFLFGFDMIFDAVGGRFGLICARCV